MTEGQVGIKTIKEIKMSEEEIDIKQIIRDQESLADEGDPNAQYVIGIVYKIGRDIYKNDPLKLKKSESLSFDYFRESASKGNPEALFELGKCYEEGRGVAKNINEAVRLYTLSDEKGNSEAAFALGVRYHHGYGVPRDEEKAISYFRSAASSCHQQAKDFLSMLGHTLGTDEKCENR